MWVIKKEMYSVRDNGISKDVIVGKYMARVPGDHFGQKLGIRIPAQVMDRD